MYMQASVMLLIPARNEQH